MTTISVDDDDDFVAFESCQLMMNLLSSSNLFASTLRLRQAHSIVTKSVLSMRTRENTKIFGIKIFKGGREKCIKVGE